ncbi:hypothetical protein BH09CHL1_BH09CHL1_09120 [soil metagenome]
MSRECHKLGQTFPATLRIVAVQKVQDNPPRSAIVIGSCSLGRTFGKLITNIRKIPVMLSCPGCPPPRNTPQNQGQ